MLAESIVDDTLRDVQRFRILCVGSSGTGKSSLVNCVFRLKNSPDAAPVSHWMPGYDDIDRELTSPENKHIVLHYSTGFKAGDTKTSNVDRFIRQRCDSDLPLKDQLHVIWLCRETPTAGGRILERGDENLLRLAHETGTPVVLVFTKYDLLVRTERCVLQEENDGLSEAVLHERSKEEAQKTFDKVIWYLERTLRDTNTPKLPHVNVSDRPGYEASISHLIQLTGDVVSDKVKLMWEIAQPESNQAKINASIDIALGAMGPCWAPSVLPTRKPLRDCLGRIHRDIVACWNFRDEEKTLSSDGFKQLMLYLVQDVHESQNQDAPYIIPLLDVDCISTFFRLITGPVAPFPLATAVIGLTCPFVDWFWSASLDNGPSVRRLLMAYTTILITVLKSLFDIVESSPSEGTMWFKIYRVFQTYKWFDPRVQLHRAIFQHDRQIGDSDSFRRELRRNTQGTGALLASSSGTGEPLSSPGVPGPSPGRHEDFDIYPTAVEHKYRKQSNYIRTHERKSSVSGPNSDLPDTDSDSDSTVENEDRRDNHEGRLFGLDSESYIAPRSEKTMSKHSFSTYSVASTSTTGIFND